MMMVHCSGFQHYRVSAHNVTRQVFRCCHEFPSLPIVKVTDSSRLIIIIIIRGLKGDGKDYFQQPRGIFVTGRPTLLGEWRRHRRIDFTKKDTKYYTMTVRRAELSRAKMGGDEFFSRKKGI